MKYVKKLSLSSMFLALGLVLPFFTGQIPQIGSMLLPMHLPVFLCGLICGWKYGLTIGFILPLMRFVLWGMPPLYPTAIAMTFELGAYGLIAGFLFNKAKWQCIRSLYRSMIAAMLGGRAVWGLAMTFLLAIQSNRFTLGMFLTSSFLNAIPGILLQLILIPAVMLALDKTHLVPFKQGRKEICTADFSGR